MLLELMDDSVRREVLERQLGQRYSNTESNLGDDEGTSSSGGSKQSLLRAIEEALEQGDTARAEELRDEFVLLKSLRADHTQAKGNYDRYLDQDEWYMQARRKAMGL